MLTREELKNAHNNVMTIMENRIMQMTNCDRATANLVANEILDLDRESEQLLSEEVIEEKYYYELVVSILDKDGNRRESISITGSNDKDKIYEEREKLRTEIAEGKYDKYADKFDEIIITDIEVHDDETNDLLWLED